MGNRLSKIATCTGDDGTTGLGDGSCTAKDSLCVAAIDDVDELNSHIGVLLTEMPPGDMRTALTVTQYDLFDLGGELCIPGYTMVTTVYVLRPDQWLADYNADLPRLVKFIPLGGSHVAAQVYICRTVACRAERNIIALDRAKTIDEVPRQYVNRLSDLLFVLAHVFDRVDGGTDVLWKRDEHKPV